MAKIELELRENEYVLELNREFYKELENSGNYVADSMNKPLNFIEVAFRMLMKRASSTMSNKIIGELFEDFVKEYDTSGFISTIIEEYGNFFGTTQQDSDEKPKKQVKKI